jgi:hypothetical protein
MNMYMYVCSWESEKIFSPQLKPALGSPVGQDDEY